MRAIRSLSALCLAALSLGGSLPALAQTEQASQPFPVTGRVPQTCAIQQGKIEPGSLVNIAGLDGDTMRIIQFVDPATLSVRAASATIDFAAVCNFPHALRVESQNSGLWPNDLRISDRPAGFAYAVPYLARLAWGPAHSQLDANAKIRAVTSQTTFVPDPVAGDLKLNISVADGASNVAVRAPVVAGTYVDTVRIFLEPR